MTKDDQMALAKWLIAKSAELKEVADAMPQGRDNRILRAIAQGRASGVAWLVQDVLSDTFPLVPRRK